MTRVAFCPLASTNVNVLSTTSTFSSPLSKLTVVLSVSSFWFKTTRDVCACPCTPVVSEAFAFGVTSVNVGV